jgi:cytochrome c2
MKMSMLLVFALLIAGCGVIVEPSAPIVGDTAQGAQIFQQGTAGSPPCSTCHRVTADAFGFSVGPNLSGIAQRAAIRIEGLNAEEYIRQSILEPHSYVVAGYRDIMYSDYSEHFNEQDIADLIAYLMTLG